MAFVRLFRRMYDLVSTQRRGLPESLAADLADERPSARVNGHMPRQIVVSVENFTAFTAFKAFLLGGVGG